MRRMIIALSFLVPLAACERTQAPTGPEPKASAEAADRPQAATPAAASHGGMGSRVFVIERETESLAVYDYMTRELLPTRITGLGDLRHALMVFTPDLRFGYVATRSGQLARIDLTTLELTGNVATSSNSIDNAISQDGRTIAVAEYEPGGVNLLDAYTLEPLASHPGWYTVDGQRLRSRATGMVDAPGNRFVAVLIEGAEIWIIDGSKPGFPIERRIPTAPMPYDAMITPDGRYYLVGHLNDDLVTVLDLEHPEAGVRRISLRDPSQRFDRSAPAKLPHMASWAVAGDHAFVPLVGERRLVVLNRNDWSFVRSIPLRGHPVYAVRSPTEREVWVSFSGEQDDAFIQVIDTQTLEVARTLEVGGRIYHLDFTPRGGYVLATANRANELVLIDANRYEIVDRQTLRSPSGVFGPWRAFRLGL